MSRLIQVFEHEKLTLNKDQFDRFLQPEELARLINTMITIRMSISPGYEME